MRVSASNYEVFTVNYEVFTVNYVVIDDNIFTHYYEVFLKQHRNCHDVKAV
jgi:hypothetical protein